MVLYGICIRKDRRGILIAFKIMRWEKVIYLKRYLIPPHVKAPELPDTAMLAEKGTGQIIEPEDIINGTVKLEKPLEPEDICNAKL